MLPSGVSRMDRMRFFYAYMLANPSVCAAYKKWARRIMIVTYRRFRRKGWISKQEEDSCGNHSDAAVRCQ
jgi:hypothetical protein